MGRVLFVVTALASLTANALQAQGSLLERWVADFLTESWRPIWLRTIDLDSAKQTRATHVVIDSRVDALSLGSAGRMSTYLATLQVRQRIGATAHRLRVGVTQDGRNIRTDGGDPVLQTRANPVVDLGLELNWAATPAGDWRVLGIATADRGLAGALAITGESDYHTLELAAWRTHARPLQVMIPTEAVTDVVEEHAVDGLRGALSITNPHGTVRPTFHGSYEKSDAVSESVDQQAFLTMSPEGRLELASVGAGLFIGSRTGFRIDRRWQTMELAAPFMRSEQQAGKLFFGRVKLRQWVLAGWHETVSNRWEWGLSADEVMSAVSARLETWPYVSVWEQLGATAFRYRGSLDGNSVLLRLRRRPTERNPGGFAWGVSVGRYVLDTSQENWLVTGLGFGRAEEDSVASQVRPAVVVGVEFGKAFALASGIAHAFLAADLPVYGKTTRSNEPAPSEQRGLAGQLRLGLAWWW